MNQTELDKNLMVVTAIQGYAENHHILETEAYEIFKRNDLFCSFVINMKHCIRNH